MNPTYNFKSISVYPHHIRKNTCSTRAKYREGKKDTAVKVYTVAQESTYLLITNMPAVGASENLRALCDQFGIVADFRPLDDYPTEEFTEAYLVKYDSFPNARIAKKQLDDLSFFGNALHVCYAPEFETVNETRLKLQERRKYIAWKTNSGKKNQNSDKKSHSHMSKNSDKPDTYVWAGKEYKVQPPTPSVEYDKKTAVSPKTPSAFVPRQCQSSIAQNLSNLVKQTSSYGRTVMSPAEAESKSYKQTVSQVRSKISSVSVPNVRVSLKRKKRL